MSINTMPRLCVYTQCIGTTSLNWGNMFLHVMYKLMYPSIRVRTAHAQMRSAFDQLVRLVNCARIPPIVLRVCPNALRNWSILPTVTNWSNALRIWPNAQIGQMRLTYVFPFCNMTHRNRKVKVIDFSSSLAAWHVVLNCLPTGL